MAEGANDSTVMPLAHDRAELFAIVPSIYSTSRSAGDRHLVTPCVRRHMFGDRRPSDHVTCSSNTDGPRHTHRSGIESSDLRRTIDVSQRTQSRMLVRLAMVTHRWRVPRASHDTSERTGACRASCRIRAEGRDGRNGRNGCLEPRAPRAVVLLVVIP